jgi:mannose-6-phosphate isomerase-like protein (cupin superfamily)
MKDSNECKVKNGAHYAAYETGAITSWPDRTVELPGLTIPGKHFLKEMLGLTSCEISINSTAPGNGMSIYHNHQQNEEIYIFIQGKGQVQVDGEVIDVQEGSIVRIAPDGERVWRNNGKEHLVYIIIQAKENSLSQYGLNDATVPEKAVSW